MCLLLMFQQKNFWNFKKKMNFENLDDNELRKRPGLKIIENILMNKVFDLFFQTEKNIKKIFK